MRPSIPALPNLDWTSLAGGLAVVAMLLLASPGVRVVRAEEALRSEVAAGPRCTADGAAADRELDALQARLAEIQRRAEAEAAAAAPGDVPVALNNRGYNDGPPPGVDLGAVLRDLEAP